MGMFDYVTASHPAFTCEVGHDLRDHEFQTKDFDCVLGMVTVGEAQVTFENRLGLGVPEQSPYTGTFNTYTGCRHCSPTEPWWHWVEFEVKVEADRVVSVKRLPEAP